MSEKNASVLLKLLSCTCSVLGAIGFVLVTFLGCVLIIFCAHINAKTVVGWIVIQWGRLTTWLFRLDVHVRGVENLPKEGCLLVFNHTSHLDVTTAYACIPKRFSFGAKIELFKIPLFARTMRVAGILPIERRNRAEVFKVYTEAQRRIAYGESFMLAPEGTRQDGKTLGAFRSGPFVLAINARAKIVPVVIKGLNKAFPKGQLLPSCGVWRPPVEIIILPGTETKDLNLNDRANLQESIRDQMLKAYHSE